VLHDWLDGRGDMPPPPLPPLLGDPGVMPADAVRGGGDAVAFVDWIVMRMARSRAGAPAPAPPASLPAIATRVIESWERLAAAGGVHEAANAVHSRLISPAYGAVVFALYGALAAGDSARAVAAGVALASHIAGMGALAAHAMLPLLLGLRVLPLLRAAGEAESANAIRRAICSSHVFAPALFQEATFADLGEEALGEGALGDGPAP
jgi:hypothetical protein